ncbi:MAG: hypothetical protein FH758_04025 [Firmicutes bacterium]|nr:hypothetical protein [Bacillota bacterium]
MLAKKQNIPVPQGNIIEMHLDTKMKYNQGLCHEKREQFKADLDNDLKLINKLRNDGKLGKTPIIVINSFNKFWLEKATNILDGKRHSGVVLTKCSCNLYKPKKHKKVFNKMFPGCYLEKPGRHHPYQWDLVISKGGVKC